MDDEAVDLALGVLADISVNTKRMVALLEEEEDEDDGEKRKKTDFSEQDAR